MRTLSTEFALESDRVDAAPFNTAVFHFSTGDVYVSDRDITIGGNFHYGIVQRWGEYQAIVQPRDGVFQLGKMALELVNFPAIGTPKKRFTDLWAGLGVEGVEVDVYQCVRQQSQDAVLQNLLFAAVMRPKQYRPNRVAIELYSVSERYLDRAEFSAPIDRAEFPHAAPEEIGKRLQIVYGKAKKIRGQAIEAGEWGRLRGAWSSGDVPIYPEWFDSVLPGDVIRVGGITDMTVQNKQFTTVSFASKASQSTSIDSNQYTTSSHTPAANKLQIAVVANSKGSAPDLPVLSGNSLTWVQLGTQVFASNTLRLTYFAAIGAAPTAGITTVDFSATQTGCMTQITEVSGATGSVYTDVVGQIAIASGSSVTSLKPSIPTPATRGNASFQAFSTSSSGGMAPLDSDFTELFDSSYSTPTQQLQTQGAVTDFITVQSTFSTASGGMIAARVKTTAASVFTSSASIVNSGSATSYATGSHTPGANALQLFAVYNRKGSAPDMPTVSGNGLTWWPMATKVFAANTRRVTLFAAIGSAPTAGATTVDFAGQTQTGCVADMVNVTAVNGATVTDIVSQVLANTVDNGTSLSLNIEGLEEDDESVFSLCGLNAQVAINFRTGFSELFDTGFTGAELNTQYRMGRGGGVSFSSGEAVGVSIEILANAEPRLICTGTPASYPIDTAIQLVLPSYSYLFNSLPSKSVGSVWVRNGGKLTLANAATYTVSAADSALAPGRTVARVTFTKPVEHYNESIKEQAGIGVSVAWDGTAFTGTTSADFPAAYAAIGNYNFSVPWTLSYTNVSSITAKINGVTVFAMSSGSITTNTNPYTYSSSSKTISVSLTITFGAGGGTANFVLGTVTVNYSRDTSITETVTGSYSDSAHAYIGDEVFADVDGCLDPDGTYTGTASALIERCADVMHHFSREVVGIPATRVDAAAFVQARTDSPTYMKFAGAIGERPNAKTMLLAMGAQGPIQPEWPADKLTVRYLKSSYGAAIKTLTERHIVLDSLEIERGAVDDVQNVISVLYGRDWSKSRGRDAYAGISAGTDAASIAKYGRREQADRFMCDLIAASSITMANDLRDFYLARLAEPPRLVSLIALLDQYEILPGDIVALSIATRAEYPIDYFDALDGSEKFLVEQVSLRPGDARAITTVGLKLREVN